MKMKMNNNKSNTKWIEVSLVFMIIRQANNFFLNNKSK